MNQLKTDLKVGSKFKAGELLAYDPKYINGTNDMFGDPLAVMGTMARVAVETNGSVYEDACYITNRLAHRMTTKMTRQKRVILSRFANISKIAKIGDRVSVNDPILVFDDTEDEFFPHLVIFDKYLEYEVTYCADTLVYTPLHKRETDLFLVLKNQLIFLRVVHHYNDKNLLTVRL